MDADRARALMVETQVRTNDVTDPALHAALRAVPREAFCPPDKAAFAYAELAIAVDEGRALWAPRDLAKALQAARLRPGEAALILAGADGYLAALAAAIGARVVVHDTTPERAERARAACAAAGLAVAASVGPLEAPPPGPFDAVIVAGAGDEAAPAWTAVLRPGGRLVAPLRERGVGKLRVFTKSSDGAVASRIVFDCSAPFLPERAAAPAFTF